MFVSLAGSQILAKDLFAGLRLCSMVLFLCLAQDFVPVCQSCDNTLLPFEGDQRCPICKGQKGAGKCFQFDCRDNCLRYACGELPGVRPTYCGSHPFFGGYRLPVQVVGDSGPPLWEEEVDVNSRFTLSIASSADSEVLVFPGKRTAQDRVSCSWATTCRTFFGTALSSPNLTIKRLP